LASGARRCSRSTARSTAERPRTRCVVGAKARGQLLLKGALPDRGYDALVASMTGA
jgi:hypothetical protein